MTLTPAGSGYDVLITSEVAEGVRLFVASNPAIPNCFSQGRTPEEALANLADARLMMLEHFDRFGIRKPEPTPRPRTISADQRVASTAPSSQPFRIAIAA